VILGSGLHLSVFNSVNPKPIRVYSPSSGPLGLRRKGAVTFQVSYAEAISDEPPHTIRRPTEACIWAFPRSPFQDEHGFGHIIFGALEAVKESNSALSFEMDQAH
jgi:hypothetical protein